MLLLYCACTLLRSQTLFYVLKMFIYSCSCLIARNLLSGLKTCAEVSNYMFEDKGAIPSRPLFSNSTMEDSEKVDGDYLVCLKHSFVMSNHSKIMH